MNESHRLVPCDSFTAPSPSMFPLRWRWDMASPRARVWLFEDFYFDLTSCEGCNVLRTASSGGAGRWLLRARVSCVV